MNFLRAVKDRYLQLALRTFMDEKAPKGQI